MIARALCLLGVFALLAACGGSGDVVEGDIEVEASVPAANEVTATIPTIEGTPTVEDEVVESTPPTIAEDPGVAEELGLRSIELFTDAVGGGPRPVLSWSEVADAVHYHVVVATPDGASYWAWRTSETSVPVGGTPQLEPDAAGPSISPGMSWSVLALGADGTPIALSGRRPIAP